MKSMGKLLRTLSGDGMSPRSSGGASRRTRSPHRSGRAQLRRNKTMENRPHTPPPRDAQIYCNDMYTADYVLNSIEDVAQNAMIDTIVLEDLIERNHERITKTVLDLFVESTQSASLEQENGNEQSTDKLRSSSTTTASTTSFHSSLSMGANSGSFHNSSKHMRSSRKNRNSKKNNKKPVIERRVWKKIVFVDCISDSYAYERYLDSKRDFVASLTRFLRMKGFQNDLPIRFEAKIEIHTLLEAPTILQLLQAIQQDTTVTRVEFGGALGHTERRVPEEFEKLIDPDTVTVKEMVKIHLHYDKQSLNIDQEDILDDGPSKGIQGASISQRKGKQRRTSQLDPGVLMTIQRCAIILERKMLPEDGMGSSEFLLDASELSESMEGSRRGARPSYLDQRPSYLEEKDDDSDAKAIPLSRYTSDYATDTEEAARPLGMLTADEESSSRFLESSSAASAPKLQQRRESPKRREEPLRMVDNSEPGVRRRQEGSGASAGFKRAHTVEGCRPRSSSPSNPYGAKPKTPVRRAHTVDDTFWDGGLENGKDNDGSNNSTEQQWMEEWAASTGGRSSNSKPKIGKYKRQSEEKKLLTPPESPATSPTSIRKKPSWSTPPASPSIDSAEHGSPSRPSRLHRKSRSPDRSSLGDSSRKHHHHTNGIHDNDSKEKKVSDDSMRDDKSERKKDKKIRDHSMVDESERSSRSRKKDKKEKKAMKDHSSMDHSERSSRKKKDKKKKKKKESDEASLNGHSGHSTDTHKSDKSSRKKKKKDPEESSSLNGHSSHSTGSKSKHNNKKNHLPDNPSRAAPTTAVSEHSPLAKKKKKVRNPRDAPEGLAPPTLRRVASDTPPPKEDPASASVSSVAADPPGSSKRRMRRTQSFSGRGSALMGGFDWNCFLGESTTNGLIDP